MNETEKSARWSRRISWAGLILLLLLFFGHLFWAMIEGNRLQNRINAIKQSGEPIQPADFNIAAGDPAENGGQDIATAAKLVDTNDEAWKDFDYSTLGLPLRPEERALLTRILEKSEQPLSWMRTAATKKRFEMEVNLKSPVLSQLLPELNTIRSLATVLLVQAIMAHDRQDDQQTLQSLEQIMLVGRYVDTSPTLVGHLVAVGSTAMASDWAEKMAPDLRIGEGEGQASPAQVRHLIDRLLDEQHAAAAQIKAMQMERTMQVDTMTSIANGLPITLNWNQPAAPWNPLARYAMRPVLYHNGNVMIDHMAVVVAAAREKNLPDMRAKMPDFTSSRSLLNIFASTLVPSLNRAGETHFRVLAERRLAAIALAMRWYAVEHNGKFPEQLEELVPKYLPAIPKDPLAAGDPLLKYLPNPQDLIIYSAGVDGRDDNGSESLMYPNKKYRPDMDMSWELKDRVVHLNRQPRPEPPAPEPEPKPEPELLPEVPSE